MPNHRPYREINKAEEKVDKAKAQLESDSTGLRHTVLGAVLVMLMGLALWFLLSILPPSPSPIINDRAPALERLYGGGKK